MSPQAIEAIGLVAALLTTTGFVPQVYKTWRSRDVRGLSVWMYLVLFLGTTLWLAYGLLTDSLPTMGAGKSWRGKVSGKRRIAYFNDAIRRLPSGIPLNIILYPMEGDPLAAVFFWRLAAITKGSFFCPSRDWP